MLFSQSDEWYGVHEQITAENEAGVNTFDPDEWEGVHEHWTLEQQG
jgi:hypothetical protein